MTAYGNAVMRAEIEDREDVRMVQRRDRVGLALESRHRLGIVRKRLGKHLHRDLAIQLRVPRPVHLAHPARAERCEDLVRAEAGAGRKSQCVLRRILSECGLSGVGAWIPPGRRRRGDPRRRVRGGVRPQSS